MNRCDACAVDIEGNWASCPLCGAPTSDARSTEATTDGTAPEPYPAVGLRFSRRRVLRTLFLTSLAVIAASLIAQLLVRDVDGIGVLRSIWLGVTVMWLVVIMAIRQRRNVAKGTLYLVVLIAGLSIYGDYLTGWHRWSLTWAVPIICASSILALLITLQVMRTEVGDHIVYSASTVLLGLAPVVFLIVDLVNNPLPSAICAIITVLALAWLQLVRGRPVRQALAKRLHL